LRRGSTHRAEFAGGHAAGSAASILVGIDVPESLLAVVLPAGRVFATLRDATGSDELVALEATGVRSTACVSPA
jgi:hypothetical protein